MRLWPWRAKPERREAGGGYTNAIVSAIEAQASTKIADASSTAAIEAAAGALSRAFMSAEVEGPDWIQEAVTPIWLAQVGRSLIREGASLSVIVMGADGLPELVPAAFWKFREHQPRCAGRRAGVDVAGASLDLWAKHVLFALGRA